MSHVGALARKIGTSERVMLWTPSLSPDYREDLPVIEAYGELNNAITWDTTCLNCASLLDKNYEQYVQLALINEIDAEEHATGSRDFGRGFQLAMRLVREAQDVALTGGV